MSEEPREDNDAFNPTLITNVEKRFIFENKKDLTAILVEEAARLGLDLDTNTLNSYMKQLNSDCYSPDKRSSPILPSQLYKREL